MGIGYLVRVLGGAVLGDDAAVVGHQETIVVEDRVRSLEARRLETNNGDVK